jgi:hypothetical protein
MEIIVADAVKLFFLYVSTFLHSELFKMLCELEIRHVCSGE